MSLMNTVVIMSTSEDELLGLLYLSSPALPIGAFAYSQGLEKAIENEVVNDQDSLERWCRDCIRYGLSSLDLPLLLALRSAIEKEDECAFQLWNDYVFACRETFELYEEERNLGLSMRRLLKTQDLLSKAITLPSSPSLLGGFAMMSLSLGLSNKVALVSFCWSWLENQVAVACKSIPLGQTDAQRVLLTLRSEIPDYLALVKEPANELDVFGSLPGQALFSASHEIQYSRLFRS